jgi:hypothetical protein
MIDNLLHLISQLLDLDVHHDGFASHDDEGFRSACCGRGNFSGIPRIRHGYGDEHDELTVIHGGHHPASTSRLFPRSGSAFWKQTHASATTKGVTLSS